MVLFQIREAVYHEHATYVMQASQNVPGTSLSASVAGHCSSIVGILRGNAMKCAGNIYFNRTLAWIGLTLLNRRLDHVSAEAKEYKILLQQLRSKMKIEDANIVSYVLAKVRKLSSYFSSLTDYWSF